VSGTFCEELALRVLRTKGTGHLFPAHCLRRFEHEDRRKPNMASANRKTANGFRIGS